MLFDVTETTRKLSGPLVKITEMTTPIFQPARIIERYMVDSSRKRLIPRYKIRQLENNTVHTCYEFRLRKMPPDLRNELNDEETDSSENEGK